MRANLNLIYKILVNAVFCGVQSGKSTAVFRVNEFKYPSPVCISYRRVSLSNDNDLWWYKF